MNLNYYFIHKAFICDEKEMYSSYIKEYIFLLIQLKTNLNWHKQASRFSSGIKL